MNERPDIVPLPKRQLIKLAEGLLIVCFDTVNGTALTTSSRNIRVRKGAAKVPSTCLVGWQCHGEHILDPSLEEACWLTNISLSGSEIIERPKWDLHIISFIALVSKPSNDRSILKDINALSERRHLE